MSHRPRLALLAALSFAGAGCGSSSSSPSASAPTTDTPWGPCPSGFRDECRSLLVPLDPASPNGPKVPVFVSHAPSFTASQADLWLLSGGPGQSADLFGDLVDQLRAALPGFDVYTLEHRGVGESARLGCPDQESPSSDEGASISLGEMPACLAAVQKTWPNGGLAHFRLTDAARDLGEAINRTRTPGKPVFVYGVSYGTAVAIRYLQLRPDDAAGVILDSVAPPGISFFSQFSGQYDPVLHALADLCAADADCAARLGADPWSALSPVPHDVSSGSCPTAQLTRADLSGDVDELLQSDADRVVAMALLHRVDRCSSGDVDAIAAFKRTLALRSSSTGSPRTSQVLYWNVVFADLWEAPAPSLDTMQARCDALALCDEGSLNLARVQALWPAFPPDPLNGQPITTTSPVLVLSGDLDPQTPVAYAAQFVSGVTSPHLTFAQLPNSAHDTVVQALVNNADQPPCGYQILLNFLQNPASPDTSCIGNAQPVSFEPSREVAMEWFGTSDVWDDEPPADAGAE